MIMCGVLSFVALTWTGCATSPRVIHVPAATSATQPDACESERDWGQFPGTARFENFGHPRVDRLLQDFCFTDKNGKTWTAKAGLLWDGGSIPQAFWTAFGSPKTGCYQWASIVHDQYYKHRTDHSEPRKAVDEMFYQGCRAKGVGRARAATMYYAVRWFGERWDRSEAALEYDMPETDQALLLMHLESTLEVHDYEDEALLGQLDRIPPNHLPAALASGL
jgi:hypothetical protein